MTEQNFEERRSKYPNALCFPIPLGDCRSEIALSELTLNLSYNSHEHEIVGKVVFDTSKLDLEFHSDFQPSGPDLFLSFLADTVKITSGNPNDPEWMITSLDPFTAVPNPAHIITSTDFQVQSIMFTVVNFVDFIGTPINYPDGSTRRGRIVLEVDGWKITIDKCNDLTRIITGIKKASGFGITHVGVIERSDGKKFKASKGNKLLDDLEYYLAFVRGAWVPIPIRHGVNSKNEYVWHDWRSPSNQTPWQFVYTWFDEIHALETLQAVFRGFYSLLNKEKWNETIRKTIYWYVLSNTLKNVEGGIIFAQTILELLAWNRLVREAAVLSQDTFGKLTAAEQFRLLLSFLGIPFEIPETLPRLKQFAKANNWDGPGLVASIRNSLVHPGKKTKSLTMDSETWLWVRNLSLWYVEMTLLKLCEYEGPYANRVLGRSRWNGEIEPVPWKKD